MENFTNVSKVDLINFTCFLAGKTATMWEVGPLCANVTDLNQLAIVA